MGPGSLLSAEGFWDLGVDSSLSTIAANAAGMVRSGPRDKGKTRGTRKEAEAGGDWPEGGGKNKRQQSWVVKGSWKQRRQGSKGVRRTGTWMHHG